MEDGAVAKQATCGQMTKAGKPCGMSLGRTGLCPAHDRDKLKAMGQGRDASPGDRLRAAEAPGSDADGATRRTVTGEIDRILQANPRRWAKIITDRVASGRDIPPGWHRMLEADRQEAPKPVPVPSTMEKARAMSTEALEALVLQLRSEQG